MAISFPFTFGPLSGAIPLSDLDANFTAINSAIGTSAGNLIALNGSAKLPAVDGSLLTNLPSSSGGIINELRLSLLTATPVTTADQTAKTTVFLTPYKGKNISVYNGSGWSNFTQAELSVAVPANTSTPFDLFYDYNSGTPQLVATAWTNGTTRATALTTQDGVLVKSGTLTQRYVGTGCTTTVSGQTEDSKTNRYLWNYYNRVVRNCITGFSATRTTASASYVEINSEIRAGFVIGQSEDAIFVSLDGTPFANSGQSQNTAIAFDGTTAEAGFEIAGYTAILNAPCPCTMSGYKVGLAVGGHYATVLGAVFNSGNISYPNVTTLGAAPSGSAIKLQLGIMG